MTPNVETLALPHIGAIGAHIYRLSASDRRVFDRLYDVQVAEGNLRLPEEMEPWTLRQFGSLDFVVRQQIVRVTNRVTLEDVLFNGLRARRPIQLREDAPPLDELLPPTDDPLGQPLLSTPEDPFGRVIGEFCVTGANVAKLDANSGIVVFDTFNPLRFDRERVVDYFSAGWQWAQRANDLDPAAVYYLFIWNCLWRAGASLLHGHAQTLLGRGMHYGKVEALRRHALAYRAEHGANYFDDVFVVHAMLGLGFQSDGVRVMAHLTPLKEKEVLLMADPFDDRLQEKVYDVLECFRDQLGVRSFNLVLHQGPVGPAPEDWSGFPNIVRIVDRGDPNSRTSDIGALELYAGSAVSSDPFAVASALRMALA